MVEGVLRASRCSLVKSSAREVVSALGGAFLRIGAAPDKHGLQLGLRERRVIVLLPIRLPELADLG